MSHTRMSGQCVTPTSAKAEMAVDDKLGAGVPADVAGTTRNASAALALQPGYNGTSLNGRNSDSQPVTVKGADVSAAGVGFRTHSIGYAMPIPNPNVSISRTSADSTIYAP